MARHVARAALVAALIVAWIFAGPGRTARASGWKAGTARSVITPRQPMWMAGYGARNKPSEGIVHDLWAKALVLEDPEGRKAALITLDVCGIARDLSVPIRGAIQDQLGLGQDQIILACSHTHCGPVVGTNLISMYRIDDEQRRLIREYAGFLKSTVIDTAARASKNLEPVELAWANGQADFAVNRRENKEAEVPALRDRLALKGPVDHDVPVLLIRKADGKPRAIVCGYDCHCTVLSSYKFCGDYVGFAQIALEARYPEAQAMFVAGCGADQNPVPRRTVELAERYGNQLADSVGQVLRGTLRPITGPMLSAYQEIELPFAELPTREQVEADTRSQDFFIASRARRLLKTFEDEGKLPSTYPYPIAVWRLGDLTWIFLGGEVVVDYSLRLKRNLGSSHTWVSSYCNDVMAYIPSLRVLKEGGYEGATSMIYYGQPTRWGETIEEDIVAAVRHLIPPRP